MVQFNIVIPMLFYVNKFELIIFVLQDAHNCFIEYDENASLFAVYDGHGGHEVAEYTAKYLPDFIKETEAYKSGDYEKALIDSFLGFDATLATPKVINILKRIAGTITKDADKKEGGKLFIFKSIFYVFFFNNNILVYIFLI